MSKQLHNAVSYLITSPNVEEEKTKEEYLKNVLNGRFKVHIQSVLISRELHQNGTPHFHCLLSFVKRRAVYSYDVFDHIFEKHSHIQAVHDLPATIAYVQKDGDFILHGEIIDTKKRKRYPRKEVIDFLMEKERKLTDLRLISDDKVNQVIYQDSFKVGTWLRTVQAWERAKARESNLPIIKFDVEKLLRSVPKKLLDYAMNLAPILEFINDELDVDRRRVKSKNILLWSRAPSLGKTSLLLFLEKNTLTWNIPNEAWYEGFTDDNQILLFDEMSLAGGTLEFYKKLLGGQNLQLPVKGGHVEKKRNPLIIGAANNNIAQLLKSKKRFSCSCNAPLENNRILCHDSYLCSVDDSHKQAYKALLERVVEIELTEAIWPCEEEEWLIYEKILSDCIVKERIIEII